MVDGQHSGRDKPGQSKEGTNDDEGRYNKQVQVVASPFLQNHGIAAGVSPVYCVLTCQLVG